MASTMHASRWQLSVASTLLVAWTLFLFVMAVSGR